MGWVKRFTKPQMAPVQRLLCMDAKPSTIDDLFQLTLVDGIKTTAAGREICYRQVTLRETTVADERAATRMAERVVTLGGVPKLLVSDADFRYALTMRHIARLAADATQVLDGALLDLDLFGRLTSHDLGLIEGRVFLINMAAEVRYGAMSQEDFDAVMRGETAAAAAPQPVGQAEGAGQPGPVDQPGPALLADFAGGPDRGAAARHGD